MLCRIFSMVVLMMWYITTVKLDLEARGHIQRLKGGLPQRLTYIAHSSD